VKTIVTTNSVGFSVIVPTFNRAHLLSLTLDAILNQRLPPAEVIVADDGSTDNTAEIVAKYGDRVRLLRLFNGGPPAARHAGVCASQYDLIAFCDSDDLWRPDHLLKLGTLIEGSGVPYAFSNFVHVRDEVWETRDKFANAPVGYWRCADHAVGDGTAFANAPLFPSILEFQPIFPSCTAMTRRFYDHVGGYSACFGRTPSEDLEFTLRCVREAPTGIVLSPTVGVRKHSGNLSRNLLKQLVGEIKILEWSRRHHRVTPEWAEALNRQIAGRAVQAFDQAFCTSDLGLARRLIPHLLPRPRSFKFRLKLAVAALPDALAVPLSSALAGRA
jgi:glycosyltransferase involved in cell wall biosynthesis